MEYLLYSFICLKVQRYALCLLSLLPSCGELAGALFLQRVQDPLPLLKSLEFKATEVVTYASARRGANKTEESNLEQHQRLLIYYARERMFGLFFP